MLWVNARIEDLPEISGYLRVDEWKHISLSSHFVGSPESIFQSIKSLKIRRSPGAAITGIFLLTIHGYAFLSCKEPLLRDESETLYGDLKYRDLPFCLVGSPDNVERARQILNKPLAPLVCYRLMAIDHNAKVFATPISKKFRFHMTQKSDYLLLERLEELYQKEEVIINPATSRIDLILKIYKQKLGEYPAAHAILNETDVAVAKVGLTASGFKYDLLGGVYVDRAVRRHGAASNLIRFLLGNELLKSRGTGLFVKNENFSARKLYDSLGFEDRGELSICYPKME